MTISLQALVRHRLAGLVVLLLVGSGLVLVAAPPAAADDPCGPTGNAISCENSKPGSPESAWEIDGAGDSDIQGFSTDISVDAGSPIGFKIDTNASAYTITIFRMGWYGGDGARQVATVTPSAHLPQTQPNCLWDATTELTDCGNWELSATWNVPSDAVSGVYIAHLRRSDNGDDSNITFIVRNDESHSDLVFQTSDATWEAYNKYGGSDFYVGGDNGRAYKVSYNRPITTRQDETGGQDFFMANEYPAIRFLERNGYDISYISSVDTDRHGSLLTNHKTYLSVGHDEYWSGAQRANVLAARDAGVNLMFLSGNEMYWRTRYEPSIDSSHTSYRTLVSYKESWSNAKIDPSPEWTGTYRDPRFAPVSAGGGQPENAITGTIFMSNYTDMPLTVTKAEAQLRLWNNTGLANMATASTALAPHTVGYESDEDQDNGFRPPGLIDLSTTTGPISGQYMQDYASTVGDGTTTHSLTLYRAASGALVFGAGSVQWSWGLDADHDSPYAPELADPRMQQAQINLLADMGAQPTTLMAGMVAAARSTDTTGPTVSITSPAAGASEPNGSQVTVTGTAIDTGGGKVAGVEYSTDGGDHWHPAIGSTSWSFTYTQHGIGSTPLKVRAIDDSANIGVAVTRAFAVSCPCSVFGNSPIPTKVLATAGPAQAASTDPDAVEVGLRFTPATDGFVSGVRFYKGTGNTGTHVGSLWSTSGQRLASVTFTGETTAGWQTATFSSAVPVTGGTTYVVSYTAPNGHYAVQQNAFSEAGVDAYPLSVAGGYGAAPAGVYATAGQYPASSWLDSSYFVDPVFTTTDNSPLAATNHWPQDDATLVPVSTTVSAVFSKPVTSASVSATLKDQNGAPVSGTTSYNSTTRTVTFTPSAALNGHVTYAVTLDATDLQGNSLTNGRSWSFTTAAAPNQPGVCPCSLFDESTTPTILDGTDGQPITLGVRFTSSADGQIDAVRFYKSSANTGTHIGSLWTAAGTLVASGTFTGESASGWQTLTFPSPAKITKNTEYIASYYSPTGHFSVTPNAFTASDLSRDPLQVGSDAGSYAYPNAFPSNRSASNYLVDVVFEKATPSISVTSQSPAPGAVGVPRSSPVSVSFSAPITSGYSMTATQEPSGTPVTGSTALDSSGTTLTLIPAAALPADTDIKVTVAGVVSADGVVLATQTWTFHTWVSDPGTETLFSDQLPQTSSADDGAAVELGTAFVPQKSGSVTAIRFYKGSGNGGTHVGHLWTAGGQQLASVTFTGETTSGWQTATLSTPLHLTAGTRYVVSYFAPQGHYSYSYDFFDTAYTAGDLSAPTGSNGLYLYANGGGFPTYSYNASNYFVDVVFTPDPAVISVTGRSPVSDATSVSRTTTPSITFSAPLADGYAMTAKNGTTAIAGTVARSADKQTLTFTPSSALPADSDVTVSVDGITSTDGATLATQSWTFHTVAGTTGTVSMFAGQAPTSPSVTDGSPLELGTAFTPSTNGSVTKIRFYKGAGNTGTHTGSIWSSTGTRLATVTFTNETATGWQEATLTSLLALTAGQTYVVSYYSPTGTFAVTPGYFDGAKTTGPLTAQAANGRYVYSSGGQFPGSTSGNGSSYLVDVVFSYQLP